MKNTADYFIEKLGLTKHVEGGSFKETYRSDLMLKQEQLPTTFNGDKSISTGIYFLLEHGQFSAFHKIASDEMWHFYYGQTLTVYEIEPNGNLITHKLGTDLEKEENFQCIIKAGNWFGSRCEVSNGFSLVGCTVAPGFDFTEFELADKNKLTQAFPHLSALINQMCY